MRSDGLGGEWFWETVFLKRWLLNKNLIKGMERTLWVFGGKSNSRKGTHKFKTCCGNVLRLLREGCKVGAQWLEMRLKRKAIICGWIKFKEFRYWLEKFSHFQIGNETFSGAYLGPVCFHFFQFFILVLYFHVPTVLGRRNNLKIYSLKMPSVEGHTLFLKLIFLWWEFRCDCKWTMCPTMLLFTMEGEGEFWLEKLVSLLH